jgi:Uma2 family endonuclease
MTTAILDELAANPKLAYRHTVQEYHQMIATGTLEEGAPFELLDGQVVRKIRSATGEDPMTVGNDHAWTVNALADLNRQIATMGCFIQCQQPITLPPSDEPEPDAAVVIGSFEEYPTHPGAADILCIIEVTDASLRRDKGYKRELYARHGIATYVIVNLIERVVHVFTQPVKAKGRYGHTETLSLKQTLTLPTSKGKGLAVPVRRLLPPAR